MSSEETLQTKREPDSAAKPSGFHPHASRSFHGLCSSISRVLSVSHNKKKLIPPELMLHRPSLPAPGIPMSFLLSPGPIPTSKKLSVGPLKKKLCADEGAQAFQGAL